MGVIRIFVAFPLPSNWKEPILSISNKNVRDEKVRWSPEDNLHITLFFIGEVEEENLENISSALKNIFNDQKSFSLEFESIEVKGKISKPSMVWARFRRSESFTMLAEKIYQTVKEFMTIEVTHKDPIPHCTLARIKSGADVSRLDLCFSPPDSEILVDHSELWKSVQGRGGVRYERVDMFRALDS